MLKRVIPYITTFALFAFALVSNAQAECSAIVQQALAMADEQCAQTGRNQACHGYLQVDVQPLADITGFAFGLGDIADLTYIQSLTTAPLDEATGEWGVALLRVQANLPDMLPGENATFLLFGDAELTDESGAAANPMQAFRLRTGVTGTRCEDAPQDGLLIQTPHGVGRVELQVNGVDVSLGSTVFFEAQADGNLTISTLEGSAQVMTNGLSAVALPGYSVTVPMDDEMRPAGNVGAPQPYNVGAVAALPVEMLEREVVLVDTVVLADELLTPTPAPALSLATAVASFVDSETDVVANNAGGSDAVHSGNCGNGNGNGVANGCNGGGNGNGNSRSNNGNGGGNDDE